MSLSGIDHFKVEFYTIKMNISFSAAVCVIAERVG